MNIQADEIVLGKNVVISPTAVIRGLNGNAKRASDVEITFMKKLQSKLIKFTPYGI